MCGIFGFYPESGSKPKYKDLATTVSLLLTQSVLRGKDAAGLAVFTPHRNKLLKASFNAKKLANSDAFKAFFSDLMDEEITTVLGHTRLATNGSPYDMANNHPLQTKSSTAIHNGIVVNYQELQKKFKLPLKNKDNDTQVFLDLIEHFYAKTELSSAVQKAFQETIGSASIAIRAHNSPELVLATNMGSLYYLRQPGLGWWFASQKDFFLPEIFGDVQQVTRLEPFTGLCFSGISKPELFSLSSKASKRSIPSNQTAGYTKDHLPTELSLLHDKPKTTVIKNSVAKLQKHKINIAAIRSLVRCSNCILPSTTPFITFDENGVCNYCRDHVKITYKGQAELEKLLKKYRRKDGKPDCIVAFSGGRDSSYGLHYVKKVLKMNPVAFTYDWGMITDVGRRNQARLLGKLGVEHAVVSAHIPTKRKFIKQNILAWLKKPHIGMVPLFMGGDKICEYYGDQLMKKYDVKLMIYCRGNELEKEEFKTGHAGIKNADPGGVIHHLHWFGKIKLLWFYAMQYLQNPAYINASFFDTLAAFFVTYMQKHDYLYLWHYIPWDEKNIISTLKKEYGWEASRDGVTWRIDDGSPAFYGYIYYLIQGFTENDSFRSHQIREGKIDRATALRLVEVENAPRYEELAWYFDQVGLDGDKVLSIIDSMPRLYGS